MENTAGRFIGKINIGGLDYDVVYKKFEENYQGLIDDFDLTIYMSEDIKKEDIFNITLLHEIIHGLFYSMGKSDSHDEELIEGLARGFYMFLKSNPKLVEKLINN